ncbi:MAG: VCBS repeat-containing protein [Rhodopirellula sp.]|nr:VCBS repeat-containing protein [Rhodopirellula sp.]
MGLVLWAWLAGADHQDSGDQATAAEATIDEAAESRIRAFCGDCHAVPLAESFHRDAWVDEVAMGYIFYARSGRTDLDPPPLALAANYFRGRAPERIVYPQSHDAETKLGTSFTVERLSSGQNRPPAVASLQWIQLDPDEHPVLIACDMREGYVAAVDLKDRRRTARILAKLRNPCRAEPCDLDQDQATDLVIADLGSYVATDHDRGRVVWLRRNRQGAFDEQMIASGLGRVDDVRAADFDSDGDLDLLVADFGWHRTGQILLLRNVASAGELPRFEAGQIDSRPGTTTLPVADIDGDGRLDFLALVSQEYECVEAFLGQGDGRFHCRTLWRAPDLTFGSSTISLADVDLDGDPDILYANGDAFDNRYVPPWHGAQWLENLGDGEFQYHRLTDLSGACRIRAGDFDGDGDQDLVIAAFLPPVVKPETATPDEWASILLMDQTSPGQFARHVLETGFPYHAGLEVADFDGDGDLDFAVGTHGNSGETGHWVAVWWNEKIGSSR